MTVRWGAKGHKRAAGHLWYTIKKIRAHKWPVSVPPVKRAHKWPVEQGAINVPSGSLSGGDYKCTAVHWGNKGS